MSTPRITADGIKVAGGSGDWRCGNCGAWLANTFGFAKDGLECPKCHMRNRPDFNYDLASERLAALAIELERGSRKHDSILMAEAAADLRDIITDVRHVEHCYQTLLGYDQPVAVPPSFPPELTSQ